MAEHYGFLDKNVERVINLGNEYINFIKNNSIIEHLSDSLKNHRDRHGGIFEPINIVDNSCLLFSYLNRNFKITLGMEFTDGDVYQKIIIYSEIKNINGCVADNVLQKIYLDNNSCIIGTGSAFDKPGNREKELFRWLSEYIDKEFKFKEIIRVEITPPEDSPSEM